MTQTEYLSLLLQRNKNAVVIGSLGTISYDLDKIDHKEKICIKGAMGLALAFAIGYAIGTDKKVLCIIGDGAFLMKMGTIATLMKYRLDNLEVYIINNRKYESTGGQPTTFEYIKDYIPSTIKIINSYEF